ncbi:hypothetical protein L211DRAFT_234196 [Terfezia boudieri ATCC MYA-4762]|uniref:Uncharacterized protein n=1 Tax=Terfezia boudieri ATCC MYA-4762 TaxID=1051890 RepID=A0A3N4LL61_9PEZI|nr:hypothetical protein L211DRAFT_234196 [Terfezia boudieri ATCC MYA-4762]
MFIPPFLLSFKWLYKALCPPSKLISYVAFNLIFFFFFLFPTTLLWFFPNHCPTRSILSHVTFLPEAAGLCIWVLRVLLCPPSSPACSCIAQDELLHYQVSILVYYANFHMRGLPDWGPLRGLSGLGNSGICIGRWEISVGSILSLAGILCPSWYTSC